MGVGEGIGVAVGAGVEVTAGVFVATVFGMVVPVNDGIGVELVGTWCSPLVDVIPCVVVVRGCRVDGLLTLPGLCEELCGNA